MNNWYLIGIGFIFFSFIHGMVFDIPASCWYYDDDPYVSMACSQMAINSAYIESSTFFLSLIFLITGFISDIVKDAKKG